MNNKSSSGNVNVQIGDKQGYYAGSASNMARVFVMCNVVWAIILGAVLYVNGYKMGNLENRINVLEVLVKK